MMETSTLCRQDKGPRQGAHPLTDGFVHFQLLKFCQNIHTQYISVKINIPDSGNFLTTQYQHFDRKMANDVLQKVTRDSFRNWPKQDIDLTTTMIQILMTWVAMG